MKRCSRVYRYICDNLDQNLDSPRCREIKRHLQECPDCQAYLASMKQTVSLYRSLPSPHPPRAVHAKLLRAISHASKRGMTATRTSRRRPTSR